MSGGLRFTPYHAGHVLGASMFMIEIAGLKVLYTGDYSREEDRHLVIAEVPPVKPDVMICESTFGVHTLPDRKDKEEQFTSELVHLEPSFTDISPCFQHRQTGWPVSHAHSILRQRPRARSPAGRILARPSRATECADLLRLRPLRPWYASVQDICAHDEREHSRSFCSARQPVRLQIRQMASRAQTAGRAQGALCGDGIGAVHELWSESGVAGKLGRGLEEWSDCDGILDRRHHG